MCVTFLTQGGAEQCTEHGLVVSYFSLCSDQMFDLVLLVLTYRSTSLEESIKSMSLSPEEDDIPWKDLRDNRDLTVLFSWDPKDR